MSGRRRRRLSPSPARGNANDGPWASPDGARLALAGLAPVLVGLVIFAAGTTALNWVKYVSLRSTYAYDLGFFHNVAFNQTLGRDTSYLFAASWFNPGDHDGPSVFRSNHFSPMRLLLVPQVYRLWPHMATFLVLHSLIIGTGAVALYLFGVWRTSRRWVGWLLAGTYLGHPAILHMAFNDFREIQLGIAPALFALAFHARGRRVPFLAAALLMLACRGEYAFLLAFFGILNWRVTPRGSRDRFWLAAPPLLAVGWLLLAGVYYLLAYDVFFPWSLRAGAGRPEDLLVSLVERLPAFFRIMLLPALVGLLTPEAFAVALPFVAGAASVRWPAFPHHDLQHLSPAVAAVFWAFAATVVRLAPRLVAIRARAQWVAGILAAVGVAAFFQFAGSAVRTYLTRGSPRHEALGGIDAGLPADATIMVPKQLTARLSAHARVLSYEALPLGTSVGLSREAWLAILADVLRACDLVATERQEWLDRMVIESDRFSRPLAVDRFHVFVARADSPRPPDPDRHLQRALRWNEMPGPTRRWATILADLPRPSTLSANRVGGLPLAPVRPTHGPT